MPNTIIIKQSSTASDIPTAGQLQQGELAINILDEKLYSKNSSDLIFKIGLYAGDAETITANWIHSGTLVINNKLTVDNIFLNERASAGTDVTGDGQIWVRNDPSQTLWFTPEGGTDYPVGYNSMPPLAISASQNMLLAEVGYMLHKSSGVAITLTCAQDTNTWDGATWGLHNDDTEDVTIAAGASVTVYWIEAGSAPAAGSVVVQQGGIISIYKRSNTEFWVWGAKEGAVGSTLSGNTDTDITSPTDGALLLYDTTSGDWRDATMSADASITDVGAITLSNTAITSKTELASGLTATDELFVSDGGVLKRMDISVMNAYFNSALSFQASGDYLLAASNDSKTAGYLRFNDNVELQFGTGGDVLIDWDAVDLEITSALSDRTINFRDGFHIRLWDSTDTDYLDIHNDGANITLTESGLGNLVFPTTPLTFGIIMNDNQIDRPRIKDYSIESAAEVVSANAVTLTYTEGPAFEVDLEAATGNVTITVSGGPPTGTFGECVVKVQQDTTADRTLTWAGGTFIWAGDGAEVEPKTGSDAITIYYLQTWNGGTTWYINGVPYGV